MKIKISYDGDLKCTVDKNGNNGDYEDGGHKIPIPYYELVEVKYVTKDKDIQSIKIKNYESSLLNPEYMWYLGVGYLRDTEEEKEWVRLLNFRPDNANELHDIAIFSSNNTQHEYNMYASSRPLINRNEQICIFNKSQGIDSSGLSRQYIPQYKDLALIIFAYPLENQNPSIASEGGSSDSGDPDLEVDQIDGDLIDVGFSGSFDIEIEYTDLYYTGLNSSTTALAEITKIYSSEAGQITFRYKFTKCKSNALYYYYTSGSEVIPEEINYEPLNQQTEKTWCKITSTPTNENSALTDELTGDQTLTNLDPTKDYRVVVAGEINDPDASEEGLLIITTDEYDYKTYYPCITSEIMALPSHPSVSVGQPITKAQMDTLRAYRNNTPPAVTRYSEITATTGNSYKTNSISIGTKITADWYNGA